MLNFFVTGNQACHEWSETTLDSPGYVKNGQPKRRLFHEKNSPFLSAV